MQNRLQRKIEREKGDYKWTQWIFLKFFEIIEKVCEDDSIREDLTMNLFAEDLLDSLSFVELLVELEDNLGVVISPSEVTREDMDTPEKIIALVEAKAQEK